MKGRKAGDWNLPPVALASERVVFSPAQIHEPLSQLERERLSELLECCVLDVVRRDPVGRTDLRGDEAKRAKGKVKDRSAAVRKDSLSEDLISPTVDVRQLLKCAFPQQGVGTEISAVMPESLPHEFGADEMSQLGRDNFSAFHDEKRHLRTSQLALHSYLLPSSPTSYYFQARPPAARREAEEASSPRSPGMHAVRRGQKLPRLSMTGRTIPERWLHAEVCYLSAGRALVRLVELK